MLNQINPWYKPTPLQIAASSLEDAQRQRLEASASREYYAAMEQMLDERISRLRQEILTLTEEVPADAA